jgi:hypothetical protein
MHSIQRLVNVNALMQNFSTSPVSRTNTFRQKLLALQFTRVGLSYVNVSRRFR